jgi:CRISPR/Cas system-associated exonuclease Cas4 (RecB family)
MPLLTKSKYLLGLQCPKLLWTAINDKESMPEPDRSTEHKFDQGHLVGELAKKLFPDGIDIESEDFMGNIKKTKELLSEGKPLFETGIMADNLYSRADILNPNDDGWDIIEVKSSTSVKDVNIQDVSFQKYCYEKAGLKINGCFLMHINKEYVKNGEIDPKGFFKIEDISSEVDEIYEDIPKRIEEMFKIINLEKCPEVEINGNCSDPYDCALYDGCWDHLPDNNVFCLYRGGKKSFELYENGTHAIADIPDGYKLNDKQEIQKECEETGKPYINKEGIKHFLNTLVEPLYYLDFETFSTAVPLFDGTKPYQQIPFQFSLHIVNDGKTEHHSFLADAKRDPRKDFAKELKNVLGKTGSIVVYNQSFEIARLRELAAFLPEYSDWVENTIGRIVDLLVPFRNFSYYNPLQQGSASIKKVLPALTGKDYSELVINNGEDASLSFLDILNGLVEENEVEKIRTDLKMYCCLDTEGMIWIVDELGKLL